MGKNIELEQLVINKLTQAQYDALAVKNPGEMYFITDANPTKEVEAQLAELSEKVPEPISTYESFPEATAENVGMRVVYTGETIEAPYIENEGGSVSTVFLDPYLTRGHTFMLVPVQVSISDTESITIYMWQDVNGASLPDQTGNAGKFLVTNGESVEWSNNIIIKDYSVVIGVNASNLTGTGVSVGYGASTGLAGIGIGKSVYCTSLAIAIGCMAKTTAVGAIQIGNTSNHITGHTNSDANTFKVGNANGNFEMMDAQGNIPLDRLTYVTDQIGDISAVLDSINGETLEG